MTTNRTKKQKEASRENGKNSKGPVTERGLVKSSRNAMKHGALALHTFSKGKKGREERAIVQATVDSIDVHNDAERELAVDTGMCRVGILRVDRMLAAARENKRTARVERSEEMFIRKNKLLSATGGWHALYETALVVRKDIASLI